MNTRVSHPKTCSHYWKNIGYNKSNQSRQKQKKILILLFYQVFPLQISVVPIFLFDWFKVAKYSELYGKVNELSFAKRNIWANINVNNFISLDMRAKVNLEVFVNIHGTHWNTYVSLFSSSQSPVSASLSLMT